MLAAAGCLLAGCAEGPAAPTAAAAIAAAELKDVPVPLVRTLSVTLDRPGRVEVEYRADGVAPLRVVADSLATVHRLTLARLYPDRPYTVEARPLDGAGEPWRGAFRTAPLPESVAALEPVAEGRPTHPLTMLEIARGAFVGFVVVDAEGRVVWFYPASGGANGAARLPDRSLALIDEGRGLVHVAPTGHLLGLVPQDSAARRIHHDVIRSPAGALWFIAQDSRPARGTVVAGEAIWEWRPETGTLRRRWSAWDHLDPETQWGSVSTPSDWLHANALSIGPRGNVLLSLHYLNQVLSITPDLAALEWRLGGPGETIGAGDPERFSGQHTAAEVAPDRILLFDNGFERVGERYSRAVEFAVDPASGRATKVWEWRPQPDIWSRIVGLARRLPGGNTFVVFGAASGFLGSTGPVSAWEVRPDASVAWRLTVGGVQLMYRAWPLDDLAGETPAPPR